MQSAIPLVPADKRLPRDLLIDRFLRCSHLLALLLGRPLRLRAALQLLATRLGLLSDCLVVDVEGCGLLLRLLADGLGL